MVISPISSEFWQYLKECAGANSLKASSCDGFSFAEPPSRSGSFIRQDLVYMCCRQWDNSPTNVTNAQMEPRTSENKEFNSRHQRYRVVWGVFQSQEGNNITDLKTRQLRQLRMLTYAALIHSPAFSDWNRGWSWCHWHGERRSKRTSCKRFRFNARRWLAKSICKALLSSFLSDFFPRVATRVPAEPQDQLPIQMKTWNLSDSVLHGSLCPRRFRLGTSLHGFRKLNVAASCSF